jgi:D-alanyl-D-alanine carboxypeptidase
MSIRKQLRSALCALSVAWTAGHAAPSGESIASCMARAAANVGFNGIAWARVGDARVERTFGTSDVAGRVPIASDTRFNLASASKMLTAIAIGRLVDRGLVRFDASIGEYLTDLDPAFRSITIAELLDHTSGLGDFLTPANQPAIEAARTATDLLPLALAGAPAFAPGSRRAYSNSGFVVLGAVIERVSGKSYAEFVDAEVLRPAGMTRTGFEPGGSAVPMTSMSPDGPLPTPQPSPFRDLRASPAGGMFSTTTDLATLLTALSGDRLLTRETAAALTQPRPDPGGGPGTYGYGFNVATVPRVRVGHGGGAPGINAEVALYPATGAQLIALSNRDPPAATRMVGALERAIFDDDDHACDAPPAAPPPPRRPPPR